MGKIQNAITNNSENAAQVKGKQTLSAMLNALLDKEGIKKRFDELLGMRAPQFIGSIVSLVNADANLQKAFFDAPLTVIQAALKAATYDLPIDPALGYAYIVPFKNSKKGVMEAQFILGYKGMNQLALRTGAYETINATDIREGELKKYNRLTEEIEIDFIEDEDEREKMPIIGYVGYFRLVNGTKKTIYMTKKQVDKHEQKHRKGQYMGKGWRDDYDAMALKTVFRKLIGKWGLMSIDYQRANPAVIAAADAIATGNFDDELIEAEYKEVDSAVEVDLDTGEVVENTVPLVE